MHRPETGVNRQETGVKGKGEGRSEIGVYYTGQKQECKDKRQHCPGQKKDSTGRKQSAPHRTGSRVHFPEIFMCRRNEKMFSSLHSEDITY